MVPPSHAGSSSEELTKASTIGYAVDELEAPPLPEDATPEEREAHWFKYVYQGDRMPQLTLRAVIMGGLLGGVMSVSNLYTTLKVGWAFGVAITSCVMSYLIWNLLRGISGGRLSRMSILENNCMQSTASAAGYSTGTALATMFGALLILSATPENPNPKTWDTQPILVVAAFIMCCACLGVFLAIPLKRQLINREQLRFPSGIAAAATLRSLYSAGTEAVRKAYVLVTSIFIGALIGLLNTTHGSLGAIDRLFAWVEKTFRFNIRLPELMPERGFAAIDAMGHLTRTGGRQIPPLGFEPSGLLIAAGMITGFRVSFSMLLGSALLYFVVAPHVIQMDIANAGVEGYVRSIELNASGTAFRLIPWALWGGTSLMVIASLTSVALQWKSITKSFKVFKNGASSRPAAYPDIEVPSSWMVIGMIPITLAMVAVQVIAFHTSWWAGLIAVAVSFLLAMVAARSTGETDTTPVGAMGKVMQLLFAILHPGNPRINLASAGVAANSAMAASDLLIDLKSGYLLGANPRKQFIAQFCGIFFGVVAIVPAWYLMVPDKATIDKYPLPATQQWVAVTQLLTKGVHMLPESAQMAILVGALLGVVLPVLSVVLPRRAARFLPSAMGLGLSWVIPFSSAFAFFIGATLTEIWTLISPRHSDRYNIPIASGLIAGESLFKALVAMSATAIGMAQTRGYLLGW